MSDIIPFHIQEEILKRLPVKSLVQFRSVSKAWKSLINSSEFITAHSLRRHTQPQHLLVSYEDPTDQVNYVCFVDDHTFPQQMSVPILPQAVKQLMRQTIVGSSHGLICLYGSHPNYTTIIVVIWNPSVRKSIVVPVPNRAYIIGFGVCPVTCDPKIVSITESYDITNVETSYRCKVRVYTLSSGKWRKLSCNLPTIPFRDWGLVVTDRFIYWRNLIPNYNLIVSFDVTNEKFEMIQLPGSLYSHDYWKLYTSKLGESLVMLQYDINICSVWMMEHGIQKSFTKVFNIKTSHSIVGFRKSGVPIIQVPNDDDDEMSELVVYEPNSEQNNVIGSNESPYSFYVNAYMETLLLLNRFDCISY